MRHLPSSLGSRLSAYQSIGLLQAFAIAHCRPVAEQALGLGDVGARELHVARARLAVHRASRASAAA